MSAFDSDVQTLATSSRGTPEDVIRTGVAVMSEVPDQHQTMIVDQSKGEG